MTYPSQPWTFDPTLKPDAGALSAARSDVLTPWTGNVTKRFSGRFSANGPTTRRFTFPLRLDGTLTVALRGPSGSNDDLVVSADGTVQGRTRAAGSRDRVRFPRACRNRATERITVSVVRRSGSGPFTVAASYAG